jgi:hypothetical protein
MDGIFDDVITANRNLVRTFEYLEDDEVTPINLTPYVRVIYNLQTGQATPIEILTVDNTQTIPVNQTTWLTIPNPTNGTINMNIPGSALVWQASDTGKWTHELILIDTNGGILSFFSGNVLYKKPITAVP